jgi:hypothetical protein
MEKKTIIEMTGAALLVSSLFIAGYLYMANTRLKSDIRSLCMHVEAADQEALLRAGIAVLTKGKPYQYEEALANPELPYAMQEIEERLESLSSEDKSATDLVYIRHVAQNFKKLDRSCAAMLRDR